MLTKKEAKDRVHAIKNTMAHLIGAPVLIQLGPHEFEMQIADIELATAAELAFLPDKVYNEQTGKQTTPQVMKLRFSTGEIINIVLDDIDDFSIEVNAAVFKVGKEVLRISYDRKDTKGAASSR